MFPLQSWPFGHFAHPPPPQSMPVSVPLRTASVQVGVWHRLDTQTLLEQSDAVAQPLPFPQTEQAAPPQSVSVSLPFLVESVQVAA